MLEDLGVAAIIDEVTGARRAGCGASAGHLPGAGGAEPAGRAVLQAAFADWWATTAAPRFAKIRRPALDHRRFWDAMHAVTPGAAGGDQRRGSRCGSWRSSGLDCSSVALDMTNFATFIDTANGKAPVAQRGKAKQKRSDLRLVGLGLVVTRDGGIPLTWHAYPGDRPDVTQFPDMIDQLLARHEAVCAAAGAGAQAADMTVVFDAGQNSQGNFAHLAGDGPALHRVGARLRLPGPDRPARLRPRRRGRGPVRRADRLRHPPRGLRRRAPRHLDPLTRAARQPRPAGSTAPPWPRPARNWTSWPPPWPAARPAGPADKVEAEIAAITAKPWVRRVITWQLTGDQPKDLRLTWPVDPAARAALEEEIFGKHVLITDHDDWPVPEVIAGYRSQSEAEFAFRQMKDPHVVSFSPMHHWTEHNIRVHVFTCVLALQIAHLMRRRAARAGLDLSVRELLAELAGIGETVLLYHGDRRHGPAPTACSPTPPPVQDKLVKIFGLDRYAPRR